MSVGEKNPCLVCSVDQQCCSRLSGLRLSKEEFEKYFQTHSAALSIVEIDKVFIVTAPDNGPCPHWERSGCRIYHERPIDCRVYPYEITNIMETTNKIEIRFRESPSCPQKERLLMPMEKAEALMKVLGHAVYGRQKPIVLKYDRKEGFRFRISAVFGPMVSHLLLLGRKINLYLQLLRMRDWRAINYRLQLLFRRIDLKNAGVEELQLPADRSYEYADSGGAALEKVLDSLAITSQDAIIDFGCGKGGALITLAKYPFSKITGIELSAELIATAKKNLRKLWIDNVNIEYGDATEFTALDDYNYFYFFNPFPCPVMQAVIDNIRESLDRKPRKTTIIYLNPECHDTIVSGSPFIKLQEFDHPSLKYYIYSNII